MWSTVARTERRGGRKIPTPRPLVLRRRCQHRTLAHSDMAFLTVYLVSMDLGHLATRCSIMNIHLCILYLHTYCLSVAIPEAKNQSQVLNPFKNTLQL
jgi:hypothetical protein